MGKLIRNSFILLNLACAAGLLLSYVSPNINPGNTYVFSFFGLAYPFLLIFNVLFILFWLVSKMRLALISIIALVFGLNYTNSFFGFNSSDHIDDNNIEIRVMSFNTQSVKELKEKNGKMIELQKEKFLTFFKTLGIHEIVCTQETSYQGFELIKNNLNYSHTVKGNGFGIAIFSKKEISKSGEIDLEADKTSSAIWADIEINSTKYRIYNIHLQSNKISRSAEKMLENPDIQSSKTWSSIRGILANYKNSTIVRSKQAEIIATHISSSPYPTIICGDFNDTPLSYVYKTLSKNKKDSFKIKGKGIGTTYAGAIPALRIDYILADERLDIADHQIFKENYSDHYPISARIVLP